MIDQNMPVAEGGPSPFAMLVGAPLWINEEIVGVMTDSAVDRQSLVATRAERPLANLDFYRIFGSPARRELLQCAMGRDSDLEADLGHRSTSEVENELAPMKAALPAGPPAEPPAIESHSASPQEEQPLSIEAPPLQPHGDLP